MPLSTCLSVRLSVTSTDLATTFYQLGRAIPSDVTMRHTTVY